MELSEHRRKKRYFTLIELLICIVVILILVAMLMPALSRVRYKARLVVCTNNQRQIATAGLVYASSNRNYFPTRGMTTTQSAHPWPNALKNMSHYDDRPLLKTVYPINELYCPFVEKMDWEGGNPLPGDNSVFGSYSIYFGYGGTDVDGVMKRSNSTYKVHDYEFNILVADFNYDQIITSPFSRSSHPDYPRTMNLGVNNTYVWSYYWGNTWRGRLDLNFARADGSAFCVSRVEMPAANVNNGTLKKVPYNNSAPQWSGQSLASKWSLLPDMEF